MAEPAKTPREALLARYEAASAADDFAAMGGMRHPRWQMVWPQSGEVVPSHDSYVALRTNRPEGGPRVEPLQHGGGGECCWSETLISYKDGSRWLGITLYEFEGDLIRRERVYFCQPFAPPVWRASWVERGEPSIR